MLNLRRYIHFLMEMDALDECLFPCFCGKRALYHSRHFMLAQALKKIGIAIMQTFVLYLKKFVDRMVRFLS